MNNFRVSINSEANDRQPVPNQAPVSVSRRHMMMAAGGSGGKSRASVSMDTKQRTPDASLQGLSQVNVNCCVRSTGHSEGKLNRYTPLEQETSGSAFEVPYTNVNSEDGLMSGSMRTASAVKANPSYWKEQWQAFFELFHSRIYLLLVFVPAGLVVDYYDCSSATIFSLNFLAMIPLASLLGAATETISVHTGQIVGGLLNATFGNAVEMIMCVQAVKAGLIRVVQGNLLGSILSNLLLVLGMAICASGMVRRTQEFNAQGAAANMTCQLVASISVCLPTIFQNWCIKGANGFSVGQATEEVLAISRICSVFLMSTYLLLIVFMLKTHADIFQDAHEDDYEGVVKLSPLLSGALLTICTLCVGLNSNALVESIEDVSETYRLPKAFIGVILLPIVGNAAEHSTAVVCAYKGMMDLALGVAVGSSTQIALFVVPVAVLAGWFFDQPMNLAFRDFDMLCMVLSVFLVAQVLQHGNTNWLHGAMLITVYFFIATQTCYIREEQ